MWASRSARRCGQSHPWHSRSCNAVQLLPEAVRLANGNADASDACEVGKVAPQPNRRRPKTKASDGLSAALRFGLRTSASPAVRCVVVRVACCAAWRLHAGPRAGDGVCRLVDARARPNAAGRGRTQRCSLFSHSPPSVVCCACRLAPRRVLACKSRRLPDCIVVWRLALRARTADALAPSMHCTAPCVPMRTSNGSPSTVCSKPYAFQCVRHDRHDRRCCGD
jgi:hypothetical protein